MKIAVVDDTQSDREILTKKLRSFFQENSTAYEIEYFISGESFLESFRPRVYDIVFFDIYMDKLTGMDTAQEVFSKDANCKIIFTTTSDEYLRQSFRVRAIYYLIKPIQDDEFKLAMQFCLTPKTYDVSVLEVKSGTQSYSLPTEKILYIDVVQHTTCIHMIDREIPVYASFSEVTATLKNDRRFLFCSRGIVVNMQHITDMQDDAFVISETERVPFTRRNKNEMKKRWHDYIYSDM